jgi:hypothetical protein
MSRTEQTKRAPAAARAADAPPATDGAPAPESLDKVRDILFGGQMRAVESRLQGLEERLLREQQTMRADFTKQLGAVESSAKRELEQLGEKLAAERAARIADLKTTGKELTDALRGLEKRHTKLEELSGTADAELRDGLLQHSRAVANEIERLSQRVTADLNREVLGLRTDKLDIASMSSLFTDMAGKLGGRPADGRPARNGPGS